MRFNSCKVAFDFETLFCNSDITEGKSEPAGASWLRWKVPKARRKFEEGRVGDLTFGGRCGEEFFAAEDGSAFCLRDERFFGWHGWIPPPNRKNILAGGSMRADSANLT